MTTLTHLAHHGVTYDDHLDLDADIPILDQLQAQGDVLCIPLADGDSFGNSMIGASWVPVGAIPVVRGENGGNTHLLVADVGVARWTTDLTRQGSGLNLGIVETSAPCWLLHPEHGGMGLGIGRWLLRRQREQMAEIRRVQD